FLETCKRIVQWFDVDGFRFDLMGILDIDLMNEIADMCREIKPDFMIYGEGWNMPSFVPEQIRATQINQAKMPLVGHFSDAFRECIRGSNDTLNQKGFASGDTSQIYHAMDRMSASGALFDSPQKVINYVECHDNHTLWDKNRVCCYGEEQLIRKKRQVLATAMVLLAQGIPFLHAGQEFGRSKQNVGNSYNAPDSINMIDYTRKEENHEIVDRVKELISIRKEHACFRLDSVEKIRQHVQFETIQDQVLVYRCQADDDACIVFFNPTYNTFSYTLKEPTDVLFDNGCSNEKSSANITIAPHSVVVCQETKGA
ncbi:MAG: type I pullulanase, partial [Erysipelotrichaceae bacterium]|nr:type I pullulanase [Erysipelotrichaceae bacterium]